MAPAPIGTDCAARLLWSCAQTGGNTAPIKQSLEPWDAKECLYRIYDSAGLPYCFGAFNHAGSLLAAATMGGLIRLIGLQTRCCFATIDTTKSDEMASPNEGLVRIDLMEFIYQDRCLALVSNNFLIIYDLLAPDDIQEICRVNLSQLSETLSLKRIHQDLPSEYQTPTTPWSSENSPSSLVQKSLDDISSSVAGSDVPDGGVPSPQHSNRRAMGSRAAPILPPTAVAYLKVLSFKTISHAADMDTSSSVFDEVIGQPSRAQPCLYLSSVEFIVSFVSNSLFSSLPVRIIFDLGSKVVLYNEVLQLPAPLSHRISGKGCCAVTVFTRKFKEWSFAASGCPRPAVAGAASPPSRNLPDQKELEAKIRSHNTCACSSTNGDYSIWPTSRQQTWSVFCVVGAPSGHVFLIELFPFNVISNEVVQLSADARHSVSHNGNPGCVFSTYNESDTESAIDHHSVRLQPHTTFYQVRAISDFGAATAAPVELLTNSSGTILLSRSTDRLGLIRINEQTNPPAASFSHASGTCVVGTLSEDTSCDVNQFSSSKEEEQPEEESAMWNMNLIYAYQEAIQRERFECSIFTDSPSNSEVFLLCSGKVSPSLSFFSAMETPASAIQALMLKIDLPKTGGFQQVIWNPGTFLWAAIAIKVGCIMLFGLPPPQQIWSIMIPSFEYMEANREVIETECEFDDLLWLQETEGEAASTTTEHALSSSDETQWFTSVIRDADLLPYPFLSPRCVLTTQRKSTSMINKDLHDTLWSLRRRQRASNEAVSSETMPSSSKGVWLTTDDKVLETYRQACLV